MAVARSAAPVLLLQLLACSDALAVVGSAGHGRRYGHRHHHREAPQREAPEREAIDGEAVERVAPRREAPQRERPEREAPQREKRKREKRKREKTQREAARRGRGAARGAGVRGHAAQAHARQLQGTHAVQAQAAQGGSDLGSDHSYDLDENLGEGTDALLDFDVDDSSADNADLLLDMDADADQNGSELKVNFSPVTRMRMHKRAFERDLVIKLELKKSVLATGKVLGLKLNLDTDFEPVSIQKIKKKGLVEDFNKAHPRKALHVGDQITRVNDINWHHNSRTFAQRIKGQWLAARRSMLPTPFMTLYVQRPHRQRDDRTAAQREDLHYQIYASDFTAQLRMPVDPVDNNMAKAMGWQLLHADDWKPVTIGKIKSSGIVAQYNSENPDARLLVGDELVEVDKINWHNNATKFMRRLQEKFEKTRNVPEKLRVLNLAIRRPRQVQERYERGAKDDNGTTGPVRRVFEVPLNVPKSLRKEITMTKLMGWQLVAKDDGPPVLAKIKARGLLAQYNLDNPRAGVNVGDAIIRVNGVPWHNNTEAFLNRIRKHINGEINGTSGTLILKFQRMEPRGAVARAEPEAVPASQRVGGKVSERASLGGVGADTSSAEPTRGGYAVELYKEAPELPTAKDEGHLNHLKRTLVGLATAWNKLHPDDRVDADFKVRSARAAAAPTPATPAAPAAALAFSSQKTHGAPSGEGSAAKVRGAPSAAAPAHATLAAPAAALAFSSQKTHRTSSGEGSDAKVRGALSAAAPTHATLAAPAAALALDSQKTHRKKRRKDVSEAHYPLPAIAEVAIDTDGPFREAPKKPKAAKKSKRPKEPRTQDDVVGAEDDGGGLLGASG